MGNDNRTTAAGGETRLGALDELVGYHLRRASAVCASDFSRAVAGTGMRQVLFGILSVIAANPGINQGSVGRALGIKRANMVGLINDLVDRGFVQRETAVDDRRAFALSLTSAGEDRVDTVLARLRAHEDILLGDLSTNERRQLIALLGRIEGREDPA